VGNILPVMAPSPRDPLLARVGARVRDVRKRRRLTARALAERAGLSVRFVSQLERGEANIAVGRLARVAGALGVSLASLVADPPRTGDSRGAIERALDGRSPEEIERCRRLVELALGEEAAASVSLLGLRGAGKSTIGPSVAARLGLSFVELDDRIQEAAGLDLAEIFALHGETYYRRLQARCLAEVLASAGSVVVELPGGIVQNEEAFAAALAHTTTVWLRARPEEHMRRVLAQGDTRPVADRRDAMAELRAILASRVPLYRRAAVTVDTTGRAVDEVTEAVLAELGRLGFPEPEGGSSARAAVP